MTNGFRYLPKLKSKNTLQNAEVIAQSNMDWNDVSSTQAKPWLIL
jgi:hypothetical protein